MAGFFKSLYNKLANKAEIDWDDLEAELVTADLGPKLAMEIIQELRDVGRQVTAEELIDVARRHVAARLPPDSPPLLPRLDGKPFVFLVVGINGVGKTTSCATLAHWLQRRGQPTVLAAADTFRAAAVEQLERWGQRLDIPVVKGQPNADPSSVWVNAHRKANADGSNHLIGDTAGRRPTRHNLMGARP